LAVQEEADVDVKTVVNGRKRKAETTVKSTKRVRKATAKEEVVNGEDEASGAEETPKHKKAAPRKTAKKVKVEEETVENEVKVEEGENGVADVKVKKKRTKKQKLEDIPPLEQRTTGHKLRVGAHVSIAGGNHHSPSHCVNS
jgi:AP endonuclease-1